jgi:hypothetical protein
MKYMQDAGGSRMIGGNVIKKPEVLNLFPAIFGHLSGLSRPGLLPVSSLLLVLSVPVVINATNPEDADNYVYEAG